MRAVVCAAAVWTGSAAAREALREGEGLLTAGGVHVDMDAAWNVREKGRVDFGVMEFELGLKKSRGLGEAEDGVWGKGEQFAMEKEDRVKLARGMESLVEFGEVEEMGRLGVRVICVVGRGMDDGDGVVKMEEVVRGCRIVGGKVVEVNMTHFNLTGLFMGVIDTVAGENGRL